MDEKSDMMEKRNVATERRTRGVDDEDELRREADLFGATEKRASAADESARKADEEADEDTLR